MKRLTVLAAALALAGCGSAYQASAPAIQDDAAFVLSDQAPTRHVVNAEKAQAFCTYAAQVASLNNRHGFLVATADYNYQVRTCLEYWREFGTLPAAI